MELSSIWCSTKNKLSESWVPLQQSWLSSAGKYNIWKSEGVRNRHTVQIGQGREGQIHIDNKFHRDNEHSEDHHRIKKQNDEDAYLADPRAKKPHQPDQVPGRDNQGQQGHETDQQ